MAHSIEKISLQSVYKVSTLTGIIKLKNSFRTSAVRLLLSKVKVRLGQ